ncbi:MAG: YihA family ribosome biogenesis GTP-binding protein [Firmicutes bacterium]|nr:YihA family ribosome biogenesis GTP-binding protein [Bacillota bacterium]
MLIRSAALERVAYKKNEMPRDGLPEIAFLGRSNVGKSSLINRLLGRKRLAYTSSTPGKTRALYFYRINDAFYFVDLPGYGYARAGKKEQRAWGALIEQYLTEREPLCGTVQVVDCRHRPSEDDLLMARWLRFHRLAAITVASKSDKLSRGALIRQLPQIRSFLELGEMEELLPFSARTGAGRERLWSALVVLLKHRNSGEGRVDQ